MAQISRRVFLGVCTAPLLGASRLQASPALFAAWTWVTITEALATGALSYIGGRAIGQVLGAGSPADPTTDKIVQAVHNSIIELQLFFSADIRKAIEESEIYKLEDHARAAQVQLIRYTGIDTADRKKYRRIIEDLDNQTADSIARSEHFSPVTLPTYATFVTLRTIVIRAFFEIDKTKSAYISYADELECRISFLLTEAKAYLSALEPEKRLSGINCETHGGGSGFNVRTCVCLFVQDQRIKLGEGGQSSDGNGDALWLNRATNSRNTKLAELKSFQESARENFYQPLRAIAFAWFKSVEAIRGRDNLGAEVRFATLYPP